eukprot:TRINITY_DN3906_c2_g2_i1.p1 TRINITY_DN3906_c2_g2~~TRINITY_DN3906_c2_g2_i1.p1  ORF type:complete len:2253 (+),score=559.38 TRINITY_DN3906_c2_g2_i1:214-6972(+)
MSKATHTTHHQEIEKLLSKFGEEAYRLLLAILTKEVLSSGDQNGQPAANSPEQLKSALLAQELQKLPKYPNFISLASDIITVVKGKSQNYLQDIMKSVSIPLPVQLALGLSFSHSSETEVQQNGQKFLKNKLGEITPNAVKTLPDALVHHLLYYIQTTEVFTEQAKILMQLESLRQSLLSLYPLNVNQKELAKRKETRDNDQTKLPDDCISGISLAGIMDELGPGCTVTVTGFKSIVDQFTTLTPKVVARAIAMMAMFQNAHSDARNYENCQQALYDSMYVTGNTTAQISSTTATGWNIANFVSVIKERVTEDNFWHNVLRSLDVPDLKMTTLRALTLIVSVSKETGEAELPIQHFLGDWENGEVQLSILSLCLQAPPDVVNFTTPHTVPWEGTPPWASVDLVETLLNLGANQKLAPRVVQLFESKQGRISGGPLTRHADLLLLVLLAAKPHYTELRRDLVKRLLSEKLKRSVSHDFALLARAAGDNINVLCHGLSDCFLESQNLAESILNVAVEGKWIEQLMRRCPSATLLSQIILLSGKRGGPENRLGGPQWLRKVLEGEVTIVPDLSTMAQTLLKCIELSPQLPISEIANVLASDEPVTGLTEAQKSLAKKLAADSARQPKTETSSNKFGQDVEQEANNNFAKIYHNELDVKDLVETLQRYKNSPEGEREHNIYSCMVHNLFDEFRFFSRYPPKELKITAELFGGIVAYNVLENTRLATALKYVLQNLARPPHENLKKFAIDALEKFKHRLPEWPQYCTLLKRVQGIEKMLPGIGKYLNSQMEQPAAPAPAQQEAPTERAHPVAPTSGTDISTLEGQSSTVMRPDSAIQEKIGHIIHQLDQQNLPQQVMEMRKFLQPEHYAYFAEFLVVKKASLEPSCHKLYMTLLEKLGNKDTDTAVVQATYTSIKALLASDKIRASSSERSLLKNLGSWLGLQTIGRNKPLMARDLDLKGLLFDAIQNGRLIAVVPFVAKVLEHSVTSKVFKPPNPWLMGILSLLVDLYQLQDLKLTLKFEVEVLCKNINQSISNLADTKGARTAQREKLESIRKDLEARGELEQSTDFNTAKRPAVHDAGGPKVIGGYDDQRQGWINQNQQQGAMAEDKLWKHEGAVPAQPVPAAQPLMQQPMGGQGRAPDLQELYPDAIAENVVIPQGQQHAPLKQMMGYAIFKALKDSLVGFVERSVTIACTTTRELVIKDYAMEPDDGVVMKAALQMVKCLAAHLAMVTSKDILRAAIKANLSGQLDPMLINTLVEDNLHLGVSYVERCATDDAAKQIKELLVKPMADRKRKCDELQKKPLMLALPDPLKPKNGPVQLVQKNVYEDFANMKTSRPEDPLSSEQRKSLEHLDDILRKIESETEQHYKSNYNGAGPPDASRVLSLTQQSFTAQTQSQQHVAIKKLLCQIPNLIKPDTANLFAKHIFSKVFQLNDKINQERAQKLNQQLHVSMLLNEVCLFILQSARDKNTDKIVEELTTLFIQHEKKWLTKEIAVNFIRLRLIDVSEFDKHLTKALQQGEGDPQRGIVEFAGSIIQKCLVDEKLTSQKDLRNTLDALEKIAKHAKLGQPTNPPGQPQPQQVVAAAAAQQAAQQQQLQQQVQQQAVQQHQQVAPPAAPAPVPSPVAGSIVPLSDKVIVPVGMSPSKSGPPTPNSPALSSSGSEQQPQGLRQPIVKIPSLLVRQNDKDEIRDKVFQLLCDWIMICTRKQAAAEQPEQPAPQALAMQFVSKLQQAGLLKADQMLDKFFALLMEISVEDYCSEVKRLSIDDKAKGGVSGASHPHVYQSVDAFSDLIVLLIRCCAWGRKDGEGEERREEGRRLQAEVALVSKVLSIVSKVLTKNHDYHFNRTEAHTVTLQEGQVAQEEFKQQPYFRFLSSLLLALSPTSDNDSASHHAEILALFATTLHSQLPPTRLPGFAFAWLELVSHRIFMPKLLCAKNQEGWPYFQKLLVDCLKFLEPWLRTGKLTESIRLLYKGTLKVLLVLLHDFPEFLCNYHFSFCDVIPKTCIQMRNVILSSFPRHMKLPDPLTPHLKVDRLPEILQPPTILSKYTEALEATKTYTPPIPKEEVDAFLNGEAQPSQREWLDSLVENVKSRDPSKLGSKWNTSVIHALVLHVGVVGLERKNNDPNISPNDTPSMAIFKELAANLDPEGRYIFIGALTNQLRFPNNHTYYFSTVILQLFEDNPEQEALQEQITRVLLERLVVNRPHPWGLLITFLELMKNPRYSFWSKKFINKSADVKRLFDSVAVQSHVGLNK